MSDEILAINDNLRRAIRAAIRTHYPEIPRPDGRGWIIFQGMSQCPNCDGLLMQARVPGAEAHSFAYCPNCDEPFELTATPDQ